MIAESSQFYSKSYVDSFYLIFLFLQWEIVLPQFVTPEETSWLETKDKMFSTINGVSINILTLSWIGAILFTSFE